MIFLKEEEVEIGPVNYYKAGEQEQSVQKAAATAQAGVQTVMGASFVFSASSAFVLIKILQMVDFMTLINVKHPRNLNLFIEAISQSAVETVPNIFKLMTPEQCIYNKEKFEEEEISCHITLNLGNYFALMLALFLIYLLLKFIHTLIKKTKIGRWLAAPLKSLGIIFWLDFIESIELDIYLNLFISLQKFNIKGDPITTLNYIISIACGIFCFILSFVIINLTEKAVKANKDIVTIIFEKEFVEKYKGYSVLYHDHKTKKFYQRQNRAFRGLKDLIIAFLVVMLHDFPAVQTLLLILNFLVFLVADLVYSPSLTKRHNRMKIFKGAIYAVCIAFFFTLSLVQDLWLKKTQFNYIGYPVIALIGLLVVSNLVVGIYEMILNITSKCRSKVKKVDEKAVENKEVKNSNFDKNSKENWKSGAENKRNIFKRRTLGISQLKKNPPTKKVLGPAPGEKNMFFDFGDGLDEQKQQQSGGFSQNKQIEISHTFKETQNNKKFSFAQFRKQRRGAGRKHKTFGEFRKRKNLMRKSNQKRQRRAKAKHNNSMIMSPPKSGMLSPKKALSAKTGFILSPRKFRRVSADQSQKRFTRKKISKNNYINEEFGERDGEGSGFSNRIRFLS